MKRPQKISKNTKKIIKTKEKKIVSVFFILTLCFVIVFEEDKSQEKICFPVVILKDNPCGPCPFFFPVRNVKTVFRQFRF